MKRIGLCALLGGLTLAAANVPAIQFTYIKAIDTSSLSNTCASLDVYNGEVFVNSFTNQRLLKIADPLGATPVVSQVADLSGSVAWGSGRGLTGLNIDQANGDVYIAGDSGAANAGLLAVYSNAGTQLFLSNTFADRLSSVAPYGGTAGTLDKVVVSYVVSSSLKTYDLTAPATATQASVTATFTAPYNANIRDVAVNGNHIFYSRSGTTNDAFALVDDSTTPGDLSDAVAPAGIFTGTGVNSVASLGVSVWDDGTTEWVMAPDLTAKTMNFINSANTAESFVISNLPNSTTPVALRDCAVANIGGVDYAFISGAADTTNSIPDSVYIVRIEPTSVSDWSMY